MTEQSIQLSGCCFDEVDAHRGPEHRCSCSAPLLVHQAYVRKVVFWKLTRSANELKSGSRRTKPQIMRRISGGSLLEKSRASAMVDDGKPRRSIGLFQIVCCCRSGRRKALPL